MICMLDSFIIDIKDMESFQKEISMPYATQRRAANNPLHQNIEKFSEAYNVEATFYKKNSLFSKPIEFILKMKKPVWLVFSNGEAYKVVVPNMTIVKSFFSNGGRTLVQVIKFSIEVYYE